MRWFKHFSDARRNPKIRAVERELGELGYARAMKLYEIVCQTGGSGADFAPRIDLKKPTTNREWLADEMGIDVQTLDNFLQSADRNGLIDSRSLKREVISIPQMLEIKDEYASRKSGVTPDTVGSESGITPTSEVRGQSQNPEVEGKTDSRDHEHTSLRCASEFAGPFFYTGLDRGKLRASVEFERRFGELFKSYPKDWSHQDGRCTCSPADFLEIVMQELTAAKIRWPKALLARKKELERDAS